MKRTRGAGQPPRRYYGAGFSAFDNPAAQGEAAGRRDNSERVNWSRFTENELMGMVSEHAFGEGLEAAREMQRRIRSLRQDVAALRAAHA